jgi:hypothetical protein
MPTPGPLLPADEQFTHQIVDTFARVGQTDRAWTEKLWAMGAAIDGSISLAFGLGKYTNRNVMDGFAGVSRGTTQWTVRASRRLAPEPERTTVGPLSYEVLEPLQRVRMSLADNDIVPVRFELELHAIVPPALEEPEMHISRSRYRIDADVLRFHQPGLASGWVEIDGERTEFDQSTWVAARDRSWGVRYQVGLPLEDVEGTPMPPGTAGLVIWMPVTMFRADGGSPYGLFTYVQRYAGPGWSTGSAQGGIELRTGRRLPFRSVEPKLEIDDVTRRLTGGSIEVVQEDGSERVFTITPVSDTGFHLGTGLYGGFEGHQQGEWRGDLNVEGERIDDCHTTEVAHRIHQHRDAIVRIEDPTSGDWGIAAAQTIVVGAHEHMALTEANSFT